MPIEFCCLNCRNTLVADDGEAGEKMECEECGFRATVPKPIGGELTNKRLRPSVRPVEPSIRLVPEESGELLTAVAETAPASVPDDFDAPVVSAPLDARYFDLEKQPRHGFEITVSFPEESMRKGDFETLVRSAAQIRQTLIAHLEQETQYFERGALVIIINRWRAGPDGHDVNLRFVGLLNDVEVSHYFYSQQAVGEAASNLHFGAIGVLMGHGVDIFRWKHWRESMLQRFHRQMIKKVVAQLISVLDETAERPISLGTRMARYFSGQF